MKEEVQLSVATLAAVLLMSLHLTDDAFLTRGGVGYPVTVAILTLWLCGGVLLSGRRAGYVIALLGAIFGAGVPVTHLLSTGGFIGGAGVQLKWSYHFVWTLLALGTSCAYAGILSVRGLWSLRRGRSRDLSAAPRLGTAADPADLTSPEKAS